MQYKKNFRDISLIEYLEKVEHLTFKKEGNSYRCNEHSSLIVAGNEKSFFWNSHQIWGNNIIDWEKYVNGKTIKEAVDYINNIVNLNNNDYFSYKQTKAKQEKKSEDLCLPPKNDTYKHLFAYLCKTRFIDVDVVTSFVDDKIIYEDKRKNAVFLGLDEKGNCRYATLKSTNTNSDFRIDLENSDKKYAFRQNKNTSSKNLYIFESPIDLLSFLTVMNYIGKDFTKFNCLSLGGLSDMPIDEFLKENQNIENLVFGLDTDKWGKQAFSRLSDKYKENYKVKNISKDILEKQNIKDWNDFLKQNHSKLLNKNTFTLKL